MREFLSLFTSNIFPIIAVAGAGFLLQRRTSLDPRPISAAIFHILVPALVFDLVLKTEIPKDDIVSMVILASGVIVVMLLLSWALSKLLRLPQALASAFILSVSFINSGNYGLSLNHFALGEAGLLWASIYFITSALWTNSAGVYIASAGRMNPLRALKNLARVPAVYAILLSLILRALNISLPQAISRPIELLATAMIPMMLLVLGMQIGKTGPPKRLGLLSIVVALRLVLSPLAAWFMAGALNMPMVGRQVGVLESAMPTAVLASILALQFDSEPDFVTGAILVSTLLSPITLTPLLYLLGV
ncbi:MAG: AEC family transporter [Anaerolineales bacterium]|nr:MAG: AEC family transporter [Anaerolineales bacterium]